MSTPTRFPSGVGTRRAPDPLYMFGAPDPTDYHRFFDDFDVFASASWTNTTTGTGTAALVAGDGGILALATSATSGDNVFLQKTTEGFSFETGKPAWFKARVSLSALTAQVVVGLQVTDTTPLDVTDGIYFLSTATTGALTLFVRRNATTGSASIPAGQLVAGVYTDIAWYWDGKDSVEAFQDGVKLGTITGVAANYLPDTTTTVSVGVQTGSAAIKTLNCDYILAAKSRR